MPSDVPVFIVPSARGHAVITAVIWIAAIVAVMVIAVVEKPAAWSRREGPCNAPVPRTLA